MATIGGTYLTLADWAKRQDDDGRVAMIVDLLSQTNEWLDDMLWVEGNQTDGYKTTVRTGLPSGTWRMLYQGVTPGKSTTAQITERTGNLEGYSVIDKDLADLNGNAPAFRLSEDSAFFEGMSQQMSSALAYSNSSLTPAQILGLAPRYNSLSATVATSANIIDAGGTGSDNTSIWFVGWGPNSAFGIFPRGKAAGLQHRDLGEFTQINTDSSRYQVYQSHFKWEAGLCVRDWRYVVRIANIDVSNLTGSSTANLVKLLIQAAYKFPVVPAGISPVQSATRPSGTVGPATRFAIYANRTVRAALDQQIVDKPAGLGGTLMYLDSGEWGGRTVLGFRGVPIRTVDSILNTEAQIT